VFTTEFGTPVDPRNIVRQTGYGANGDFVRPRLI
jgi:hypothetical protein